MPNRREFLKLAAAAATGVALWGCKSPGEGISTARPTEAEPTKAIPPTKKIDVTDTPNVPATKEAERLNAILAEGYPTSFSELSPEKMLSEKDFLEQLKKFPNIAKEYAQVKALLSAGLSKEKVSLSDIAFEVSSFSWDTDKYSWIVIARNSKTGEVYVPRDAKTHTRNIDMSVYGYLKEYQAGGALPFTMEPLKLPEFSGPEYKVGFARSKKGWLVATLDGGSQKGWYDFRDKEVARWKDKENLGIILVDGLRQEAGEYSQTEIAEMNSLKEMILAAQAKNGILISPEKNLEDENGFCLPVSTKDITIGIRDVYVSSGVAKKRAVAWRRIDGSPLIETNEGNFVIARPKETGIRYVQKGVGDIPEAFRNALQPLVNTAKTFITVESLDDESFYLTYSRGGCFVSKEDSELLSINYLTKRPKFGNDFLSYWKLRKDVVVNDEKLRNLIGSVVFFDEDSKPIDKNNTMYKQSIELIVEALSLCPDILSAREKQLFLSFDNLKFRLSSKSNLFIQHSSLGSSESVVTVPLSLVTGKLFPGTSFSHIGFVGFIVHELIHGRMRNNGDFEFMTYAAQLRFYLRRKLQEVAFLAPVIYSLKTGNYTYTS